MGLPVSCVHRLFLVGWALWKLKGQLKAVTSNVVLDSLDMSLTAQVWQILHLVMVDVNTSWKYTQSRKDILSCVINVTSSLSLCFYTNPNSCVQTILKGSLKGSTVASSSGERWVWTEPFPTLSWQVAATAHAENSDCGSIPSEAHAPLSFRSRTHWARQHFAQGLSMLPILLGGSQLFIERNVSSSVSVSSLQTIVLLEIFWQCHVLQVVILSGVSLGRVQISYKSSIPLKKKKKGEGNVRPNSTACELSTTCHSSL